MVPTDNGREWHGRVDAQLNHLDQKADLALRRLDDYAREVASLIGRMDAHTAWASEYRSSVDRRLKEHDDAVLELRRLVYKGVAVGTILGTVAGSLVAWVLNHALGAG